LRGDQEGRRKARGQERDEDAATGSGICHE
jgi:hypothetical protein